MLSSLHQCSLGCKYALLKNEAELNEKQRAKLAQVPEVSPQLKVAHSLKEDFRELMEQAQSVAEGRERVAAPTRRGGPVSRAICANPGDLREVA